MISSWVKCKSSSAINMPDVLTIEFVNRFFVIRFDLKLVGVDV